MDEARVKTAIETRMALYRQKQARRNPFGEDMFNSWDQCEYAIEVLEWLADELGVEVTDPGEQERAIAMETGTAIDSEAGVVAKP